MAEIKTPGFLEYFIIGEHWLRFVESGWQGDLYGSAHSQPRGTIWVYGLAAALPWSLLALFAAGGALRRGSSLRSLSPLQGYLLLWMLTPLLFFTFSGNILAAYVLPGLPALALLLGDWMSGRKRAYAHLGWFVPVLVVTLLVSGALEDADKMSQRDLVNYHAETSPSTDLYYFPKAPKSAQFYSSGQVKTLRSEADLVGYLASSANGYILMSQETAKQIVVDVTPCTRTDKVIHSHVLLQKTAVCD